MWRRFLKVFSFRKKSSIQKPIDSQIRTTRPLIERPPVIPREISSDEIMMHNLNQLCGAGFESLASQESIGGTGGRNRQTINAIVELSSGKIAGFSNAPISDRQRFGRAGFVLDLTNRKRALIAEIINSPYFPVSETAIAKLKKLTLFLNSH